MDNSLDVGSRDSSQSRPILPLPQLQRKYARIDDLSLCGVPSSPNHDVDADSEINLRSHEQMEAATDPFYTAWYGSDNYHDEIGDKCVWIFGKLNKRGGDVVWNNHPYEVQEE
jgi:hypothetical protein